MAEDAARPAHELTLGEQHVLAQAPSGAVADLADLAEGDRVVTAATLRRLCTGPAAADVDPRGIRVTGANVTGQLDLSFCAVPHPLAFQNTTFDMAPMLPGARLPALGFYSCVLPGLTAWGVRIEQYLSLSECRITGQVELGGAMIDGSLDCPQARFGTMLKESALVLSAEGAQIGSVLLPGLAALGELRFDGAKIADALECSRAEITNPGRPALSLVGAEIGGPASLRGLRVLGEVRLVGARIGGQLECQNAEVLNEGHYALSFDSVEIRSGAILSDMSIEGEIRLVSAKIGGPLQFQRSKLTNEGGFALTLFGAEIGGVVLLLDVTARGQVMLFGTKIGAELVCEGGTFDADGAALNLTEARITTGAYLRAGFTARGQVRLAGASIGSDLDLTKATLKGVGGYHALSARDAQIGHALVLRDARISGGVDLYRASVSTLDDDLGAGDGGLGSWSDVDPLDLEGFTYDRFAERAEWGSRLRRRWLQNTTGFQMGAWQQLMRVYEAQGRDDEATSTAVAMHNDRLARAGIDWYRQAGRWVLRLTVGHGYRSWIAGIWAAGIIAAFALVVWLGSDSFVPERADATGSPQPIAYAADTFLPIVDLGEANRWMPTDWARWPEWSVILLGWALTTIFVAGFTKIVRT